MTHIDAMKQGLEALEVEDMACRYEKEATPEYIAKAITSLRQAIAEAEGQEKALQALHAENERLGLYKDAYAEQEPVARAWDEGYRFGVNDERMSEANIGIAGMGMKVEPARNNPYRTTPPQRTEQEPVIDKSAAVRIATALGWEPKREWVGLTRKEVHDLWVGLTRKEVHDLYDSDYVVFHQRIEAKLKEKNCL